MIRELTPALRRSQLSAACEVLAPGYLAATSFNTSSARWPRSLSTAFSRPVTSSWSALLTFVKTALAHEAREQFRVLFLDKNNQLIADEVMNLGTVDHATVYPREVGR